MMDHDPVTKFDDWYAERTLNDAQELTNVRLKPPAQSIERQYRHFKSEMDRRMHGMEDLEKLANNEVTNVRPDRPNISSGELAGIILRLARNSVQNAPNVEVISQLDDDSLGGVVADFILRHKVLHYDSYTNDLRTRLQATVKDGLTFGFDCVLPVLTRKPNGDWWIEYDAIHYRDVFPEPGARDVREANAVFIRRYLTKGDIKALVRNETPGWDHAALRSMIAPFWAHHAPAKQAESNSRQDTRKGIHSEGFEVITLYTNTGDPFLTFDPRTMNLLRIERNLHPNKEHPVFFFIPEWDSKHPLGKSLAERLRGRQDFQDMFFNGAAKLWELSIDPPILTFGAPRAILNLGPGKANRIDNPNARVEPYETSTQALLQYIPISQGNLGSMVNISGAADQQMATQAGGGMSATPQGVDAQQALVDITTNDYQKSLEQFVSQYASYALTIWFREMRGMRKLMPSADARRKLINASWVEVEDEDGEITRVNAVEDAMAEDGSIELDFKDLAVEYFVKCVPGSMTELEDEKQLRVLKEMFVPLSQAMPAIAQTQDESMIRNAAATMQYIIQKTLELSGSAYSDDLKTILANGPDAVKDSNAQMEAIQQELGGATEGVIAALSQTNTVVAAMHKQISQLAEAQEALMDRLGIASQPSGAESLNIDIPSEQNPYAPRYTEDATQGDGVALQTERGFS